MCLLLPNSCPPLCLEGAAPLAEEGLGTKSEPHPMRSYE